MGERLRNRVRERLDAKQLNPFEAARMAGLERSFLNDLLIGRKQTVREGKLPAVASILDCDPDYLLGVQDTPRKLGKTGNTMQIAGICEAGAWRDVSFAVPDMGPLPLEPDPRYEPGEQGVYLVRGDHAAGLGILDGSLISVCFTAALRDNGRKLHEGDVVLVRNTNGNLYELSARIWNDTRDGVRLSAKPARGEVPPLKPGGPVEIVGLILRTIRVFGLQA